MTEELIWVFILNTSCSLILTGIVWFLQIVHFPSYSRFHRADFKVHHRNSTSRSAFVALPFMLTELFSSIYLSLHAEELFFYHLSGLIIVIILWLSTFFIQAPLHYRLQKGYDEALVKRLSDTNWLRTILWSAKSLVSLQALMNTLG